MYYLCVSIPPAGTRPSTCVFPYHRPVPGLLYLCDSTQLASTRLSLPVCFHTTGQYQAFSTCVFPYQRPVPSRYLRISISPAFSTCVFPYHWPVLSLYLCISIPPAFSICVFPYHWPVPGHLYLCVTIPPAFYTCVFPHHRPSVPGCFHTTGQFFFDLRCQWLSC